MAIFAEDTFTGGIQGDALATHTPDTGATWVEDQVAIVLRADAGIGGNPGTNVMGTNFSSGRAHVPTAPANADYEVRCDLTWNNASGWGNKAGVRARVVAGSLADCYEATYDEGTEQWELAKWTGFSRTVLGTPWGDAYSQPVTKALRFVLSGTSLTLYVDGVSRVTATDSSISAAGYAGLYIEGGINDGLVIDNWAAEDGGGGPPPGDDPARAHFFPLLGAA